MSEVTLSSAVRNNLLSLQSTAKLLGQTQERLATGKSVNSALDNPSNFFTASALNSRASDLSNLLDGLSNGIQTLEAADNGLTAITDTIESLQANVRQARQDSSFDSVSLALSDSAVGNISFSGAGLTSAVDVSLGTAGTPTQGTVSTADGSYTAPTAATAATFTAANAFVAIDLSDDAGDALTFDVDDGEGNSTTVTLDRTGSGAGGAGVDDTYQIGEVIAEANAQLTAAGVNVTVGNDAGSLTFTSDNDGANTVTVDAVAVVDGGVGGGVLAADTNLGISDPGTTGQSATGDAAQDRVIEINGETITLTSANAATATAAATTINNALTTANIDVTATGNNVDGTIDFVGSADGVTDVTIAGADADDVFGAAGTRTVTAADADVTTNSVDALVTTINANADLAAVGIEATNDGGELEITYRSTSTTDLTITGTSGSGSTDLTGGVGTQSLEGNSVRRDLQNQFNELRSQINNFADDSSFNGINLLAGDLLTLNFNETSTSSLDVQATDSTGAARAINTTSLGISSVDAGEFASNDSLDTRLNSLTSALNTIRSQSSQFGSNLSIVENRQNFTANTINTLETGAANLTLADTNEEGANLLALQTRQTLSTTALSLSAQSDQNVLRLF